ncbi:helix-turn-helix domain-containing protein [Spirulina sp. CCNP1310]|uniref:helix-turn-helix domain-containing protein n=1 Tax=Spirulina sp. CCNP1310 TaxID=3110249 RepID=UPI002B206E40|nr:helix-turn-helix domain-containing protein [Spirulina sp. CCNP1310]MEA5418491.1 helix-turn-helix domain-containing protein [Spirulina sp. CCNP1310]
MELPTTGQTGSLTTSISSQIETQLTQGQIYQGALTALQHLTGERPEVIHALLRALNHEAVQTTLTYLANQPAPTPPPPRPQLPPIEPEPVDPIRQEYEQIGRQIKRVRQARRITQGELARRTLIPVVHIKALEAGEIEVLPEEIYLQGFIRRIGQALELLELAQRPGKTLPDNVMPSWYNPLLHDRCRHALHEPTPFAVYAGYTVAIAGMIGGYGWVAAGLNANAIESLLPWHSPAPSEIQAPHQQFTPSPQPQIVPPDSIIAPFE